MVAPQSIPDHARWTPICALDAIIPDTGVCALVDARQIAVVRVGDDRVFAIANFDPTSKAFVLSRGIVGDAGSVAKIASPITKRCFDLATGRCLDDASLHVATFPCRVVGEMVEVLHAAG